MESARKDSLDSPTNDFYDGSGSDSDGIPDTPDLPEWPLSKNYLASPDTMVNMLRNIHPHAPKRHTDKPVKLKEVPAMKKIRSIATITATDSSSDFTPHQKPSFPRPHLVAIESDKSDNSLGRLSSPSIAPIRQPGLLYSSVDSIRPSQLSQSLIGSGASRNINLLRTYTENVNNQPPDYEQGFRIELHLGKLRRRDNDEFVQEQKGKCATCKKPLKKNFMGRPLYHYCRYLGNLHCQNCIKGERAIVPARVLHDYDVRSKKVSTRAKQYLDTMWSMPCISMTHFSPEVVKHSKQLQLLDVFIDQLAHMRQFIEVCRHKEAHYQMLNDQKIKYLMRSQLLTLQQVCAAIGGDFLKNVAKAIADLAKHIKEECTVCKLRGHYCEICKNKKVIYSFDVHDVAQCTKCNTCFHSRCWKDHDLESGISCPKCLRLAGRDARQKKASLLRQNSAEYKRSAESQELLP